MTRIAQGRKAGPQAGGLNCCVCQGKADVSQEWTRTGAEIIIFMLDTASIIWLNGSNERKQQIIKQTKIVVLLLDVYVL